MATDAVKILMSDGSTPEDNTTTHMLEEEINNWLKIFRHTPGFELVEIIPLSGMMDSSERITVLIHYRTG